MSILDKSSLVMIPSGYKEDKLYSVKPRNGDGDFTFTRASTGTRVNADGYIEEVPWNIVQYSEDYTQWNKFANLTLVGGQTSPINNNTATAFQHNGTTAQYSIYKQGNNLPNGNFTMSAYIKKGTKSFVAYRVGGLLLQIFDIENKVLGNNVFGTLISHNFVDVGNDWVRLDATILGDGTTQNFQFYVAESATSYEVTGTNGDILLYFWGAQLVKGDSPKPYIKTTDRLDIPRLDYSGGATNPTLLLEPQRTNKSYNSEDWTASGYIYNNCTATANQATSPDNTQTADQLDFGSGGGFFYENVTTITAASTYSVFVKYIDYQYIQIIGTGDANHYANFDIQNGIVGNTGSASTASIEDYGNGWYRCIINYNSGTFAGTARLYKVASLTANFAQGGGDAGSFYFWGNQMEVGTFVTSYIPSTSGTSTTRVADVSETSGLSDYIGQSEGSFILDFKCPSGGGGQIYIWDGTLQNRLLLNFYSSNTRIDALAIVGNTLMANENLFDQDTTQRTIYGVRYRENDFEVWVNGVLKATESGTFNFWSAGTLDQLDFNAYNDTAKFSGNVNKVIFTTTYPTDDEMEQLTTL